MPEILDKILILWLPLELSVLLLIQLLAHTFFVQFEIGIHPLKRIMKWLVLDGITIGLYFLVGHYALIFPLATIFIALTIHFVVCRKWWVDPFRATPKKRYYEMRGWKLEE
jgi:hypothetical protein